MKHSEDMERRIALERADAARSALERFVQRLERKAGSEIYQRAWRSAIRLARAMQGDETVYQSYLSEDASERVPKQSPGAR